MFSSVCFCTMILVSSSNSLLAASPAFNLFEFIVWVISSLEQKCNHIICEPNRFNVLHWMSWIYLDKASISSMSVVMFSLVLSTELRLSAFKSLISTLLLKSFMRPLVRLVLLLLRVSVAACGGILLVPNNDISWQW